MVDLYAQGTCDLSQQVSEFNFKQYHTRIISMAHAMLHNSPRTNTTSSTCYYKTYQILTNRRQNMVDIMKCETCSGSPLSLLLHFGHTYPDINDEVSFFSSSPFNDGLADSILKMQKTLSEVEAARLEVHSHVAPHFCKTVQ